MTEDYRLIVGDSLVEMGQLDTASVDAVVTDPPYALEFMGSEWDGADGFRRSLNAADVGRDSVFGRTSARGPEYRTTGKGKSSSPGIAPDFALAGNRWHLFQSWCEAWATEALRVLKPGGYLVSFGGCRTYHRMACGIEDAGFEIRDQIQWIFGSGMPKSKNLRGEHEGKGSGLKPANEPICLARKPMIGTLERNVDMHGTGALNIDDCRLPTGESLGGGAEVATTAAQKGHEGWTRPWMDDPELQAAHAARVRDNVAKAEDLGRWPPNLILDREAASILDDHAGVRTSGANPTRRSGDKFRTTYGEFAGETECVAHRGADTGGASRFFVIVPPDEPDDLDGLRFMYEPKTSRSERNLGVRGEEGPLLWSSGTQSPGTFQADGTKRASVNNHPTVKPTDLMVWLVKLVTPAGGLVLDPFMGSGTTGMACLREQRRFIGIELDERFADIARQRIEMVASMPMLGF